MRIHSFDENSIALFFHCSTTLVETFRSLFPDRLSYSKNRAIVLDPLMPLPADELQTCIAMALTYRLNKK